MKSNVICVLVLVLVARSRCASFGYNVSAEGSTTFEADSEVKLGLAEDPAVAGITAEGRAGGFLKNKGTWSGEAYGSTNDGTGYGTSGTVNYNHAVGTDVGGGGTLGLNTDEMKPISKVDGHWDRKVKSSVTGNIDMLSKEELKKRAGRRSFDKM